MSSDGRTCVLLANAAGEPFESTNPALSHVMLDACERALADAREDVDPERVIDRVLAAAALAMADAGNDAVGLLTVAVVAKGKVHVGWAGGEEAWLFDGDRVVARTAGHTLRRQVGHANVPDVVVRGIVAGLTQPPERLAPPWDFSSGRLVLLSRTLVRALTEEQIVAHAGGGARRLVEAALDAGAAPYAAAVVIDA